MYSVEHPSFLVIFLIRSESALVSHLRFFISFYVLEICHRKLIENVDVVGNVVETPVPAKLNASIRNIEEFVPDDYLDKSFLEESNTNVIASKALPTNDSDRSVFLFIR